MATWKLIRILILVAILVFAAVGGAAWGIALTS
jgi:hypothetical protein